MPGITLNNNEVISALSNQILSIQTYSDNIAEMYGGVLGISKADAGMYGDKKIYIATNTLTSTDWANDAEAANLLALNRPAAPDVQVITLDTFRKVFVTTDDYMSKRAFADEGGFQQFNSVVLSWLVDTRRIYEATTFNAFLGTDVTATGSQSQTVALTTAPATDTNPDKESRAKLDTLIIAEKVANVLDELVDVSTKYNDLGFVRSYNLDDLIIVWNTEWLNKLLKYGLPTVFHDDVLPKLTKYKLPARYFGTVNSSAKTADANTKSLIEQVIGTAHYFAGDAVATGASCPAGTSYQVNPKVICKIMHKNSLPFLTAFTANTEFFNPRSLTKTNFLIFGHNTLAHLKQYPMVTIATT